MGEVPLEDHMKIIRKGRLRTPCRKSSYYLLPGVFQASNPTPVWVDYEGNTDLLITKLQYAKPFQADLRICEIELNTEGLTCPSAEPKSKSKLVSFSALLCPVSPMKTRKQHIALRTLT